MHAKKNIVLIGRSNKFISAFQYLFPDSFLTIIPWRGCSSYKLKKNNTLIKIAPNIIVVCGFDYKSYRYPYRDYLKVNVYDPLMLIEKIIDSQTLIFYVGTLNEKNKKTLSRYRYAKYLLGTELRTKYNKFKMISPPILLEGNGSPSIQGSWITKVMFNVLIKAKIAKTLGYPGLIYLIDVTLKSNSNKKIFKLTPKWLDLPRSRFLDRILRFLYG
ncbi:hypothetical protein FIT77_04265 [Candidatus Methylopumilus universalis]|uniref:hypothetical protein n=1 Tax=Candidatus Methylopumilus universalis TaxID=2588536 RepID=UPI00111D1361|nr:hypothetical protein [Candidatus Methylopumilus universalis]QDC96513.1 hypothetical protein FIT77_04265 [Candidatus Methylopumilus universalis]